MAFVTPAEVATICGASVSADDITRAQHVIEGLIGRDEASILKTSDLRYLKLATAYQAVFLDANPEYLMQAEVASLSQGDLSISFKSGAPTFLHPLAARMLHKLSWLRSRSISLTSDFVRPEDADDAEVILQDHQDIHAFLNAFDQSTTPQEGDAWVYRGGSWTPEGASGRELGYVEMIPESAFAFDQDTDEPIPGMIKTINTGIRPVYVQINLLLQMFSSSIPNPRITLKDEDTGATVFTDLTGSNFGSQWSFMSSSKQKRFSPPPGEHTYQLYVRLTNIASGQAVSFAAGVMQTMTFLEL